MGREVLRVPMDFNFPLGESYRDAQWEKHRAIHSDFGPEDMPDECCESCGCSSTPPEGEGWQLWQTVSDGPISPVFATSQELVSWMCQPVPILEQRAYDPGPYPKHPWNKGWQRAEAEAMVRLGWIPSMMMVGGRALSPTEQEENRSRG